MGSITIYYKDNSQPCVQAIDWLEKHQFTVDRKRIETITHREIFQLIYLSDVDIPDILTKSNKYSIGYQTKRNILRRLRFGESLKFLEHHTELLEVPILLSNDYALSGYNEQKIKSFIP